MFALFALKNCFFFKVTSFSIKKVRQKSTLVSTFEPICRCEVDRQTLFVRPLLIHFASNSLFMFALHCLPFYLAVRFSSFLATCFDCLASVFTRPTRSLLNSASSRIGQLRPLIAAASTAHARLFIHCKK